MTGGVVMPETLTASGFFEAYMAGDLSFVKAQQFLILRGYHLPDLCEAEAAYPGQAFPFGCLPTFK